MWCVEEMEEEPMSTTCSLYVHIIINAAECVFVTEFDGSIYSMVYRGSLDDGDDGGGGAAAVATASQFIIPSHFFFG